MNLKEIEEHYNERLEDQVTSAISNIDSVLIRNYKYIEKHREIKINYTEISSELFADLSSEDITNRIKEHYKQHWYITHYYDSDFVSKSFLLFKYKENSENIQVTETKRKIKKTEVEKPDRFKMMDLK